MERAEALYAAWARRHATKPPTAASESSGEDAEADDEDTSSVTLETAVETAFAEVREYLNDMAPYDFQRLVAGLLSGMGYHLSWIAPPGPDGGVDVIAFSDPLGTEGPRIKVQVKREPSKKTDATGLRAFMSVLGQGDVGVFVSLGGFTLAARAPRPRTRSASRPVTTPARNQCPRRPATASERASDLRILRHHSENALHRQRRPTIRVPAGG